MRSVRVRTWVRTSRVLGTTRSSQMEALRRLDHVGVALGVGIGAASVLACNASAASSSDLENFVHTGKKVRAAPSRADDCVPVHSYGAHTRTYRAVAMADRGRRQKLQGARR
jgi:hypothetical protein